MFKPSTLVKILGPIGVGGYLYTNSKGTPSFIEQINKTNKAILESLKEVDTKGKSKDEIKELVCEKQLTDKMCEKCFTSYYDEYLSKGILPTPKAEDLAPKPK